MDVKSTHKFARVSARKANDIAREIRGLGASEALDILRFTPRKSANLFEKALKTAIADADHNFGLDIDALTVKNAIANQGPTLKRYQPRARGSAAPIQKPTSHLEIVLTNTPPIRPIPFKSNTIRKKHQSKIQLSKGFYDKDLGFIYNQTPSRPDNLQALPKVGPQLAIQLNKMGIFHLEQIANWTKLNVSNFGHQLSSKNRIERDLWVATARQLIKKRTRRKS